MSNESGSLSGLEGCVTISDALNLDVIVESAFKESSSAPMAPLVQRNRKVIRDAQKKQTLQFHIVLTFNSIKTCDISSLNSHLYARLCHLASAKNSHPSSLNFHLDFVATLSSETIFFAVSCWLMSRDFKAKSGALYE